MWIVFLQNNLSNTSKQIVLKNVGIPAGFLPGYGLNGRRQIKPFSVLLKETGCRIPATRLIIIKILFWVKEADNLGRIT